MYRYIVKYGINKKVVLSDKHYTHSSFNKLIEEIINKLREEGEDFSKYNEKEMCNYIYNELINNYDDFTREFDNNITCDLNSFINKEEIKERKHSDIKQVLVIRRD